MRIGVLGPLEVVGEAVAAPTRPKERAVVAFLALRAGRSASVAELVDALWGDEPPPTAVKSLQSYVARARAALGRDVLVAAADGYRLTVAPDDVDAVRFERLLDSASALWSEGRVEECRAARQEALGLWRGVPLSDLVESDVARAEAVRLSERHDAALEDRVEARLAFGDHEWAVAEGERLVTAAPLRERRWSLLMHALYAAGRQADALRAYQRARTTLVEELGIEPGEALRALEARIVAQDTGLLADAVPAEVTAAPRQRGVADALPSGTVTFVLTDIEGSTALWDRSPAAMSDVLARHDELVATAVASASGVLLKHKGEGDSTMSVFATAAAGVEAAVRLRQMLGAEPWPADCPIRVRVAVSTGEVELRDGDYFGPVVNRAARIRSVATGGQVVLGATTHALVADTLGDGMSAVSLGEHELRGLHRPEHIWELRTAAPFGDSAAGGAAVSTRPLVVAFPELLGGGGLAGFSGRDRELGAFAGWWQRCVGGERRGVLVSGEPGIGKTRLAAEVASMAHAEGAVVLYGRCDEDLAVPFQPFAEMVDHLAMRSEGDFREHLGDLPGELLRLSPRLDDAVAGLERPLASDPETERYRLFEAVASLMASIGGDAGAVLVLDDLHWASKPTLLLLRHVLRAVPRSRLLVIGTYRDTDIDRAHPLSGLLADLRREHGVERLALDGLTPDDVEAFVVAIAGHELDDDARTLATLVHAETSGNPLFVGEVLRHLVETGAVQRLDGRWRLAETTTVDTLPEGVKDVIGRRLNILSPLANEIAICASVIGRGFPLDVLAAATGRSESEVLDALDETLDARLVEETGPDHYRFAHALVRATLYEELRASRRVRLHRAVGNAYETLVPDDVTALAHHFAEAAPAGEHDRAVRYTLAAAERASTQLALAEAAELRRRALDLFDDSGESDDGTRCDLLLGLARAERSAGGDYHTSLAEATTLARALGDGQRLAECALLPNKGWASVTFAVNELFVELLDEALGLLAVDSPTRALVLATLAVELHFACDTRRIRTLVHEAVSMIERIGAAADLRVNVLVLALAATQGWPDADVHRGRDEQASAIQATLPHIDDPRLRDGAEWVLVSAAAYAGRYRHLAEIAPAGGQDFGPQMAWMRCHHRAGIALTSGQHHDVERMANEGLAHAYEATEVDALPMWGNQMLYLRRQQGRPDDAVPLVRQALESGVAGAYAWNAALAMLLAEAGRESEATAPFQSAAAAYRSHGVDGSLLPVGAMLSAATADLGDREVADWLYDKLEAHADFVAGWGAISCVGPVSLALGRLASCLDRTDVADAHLAAAIDWAREQRMPYHLAEGLLYRATNLLRRHGPGDRDAASALLGECTAIAEPLDLGTIVRRIARARDDLAQR